MLGGGGHFPELKNKHGYKILVQNYMQFGHLEYESKGERAILRGELVTENELDHGWRGSKGNLFLARGTNF
jgi:hypothetical protein